MSNDLLIHQTIQQVTVFKDYKVYENINIFKQNEISYCSDDWFYEKYGDLLSGRYFNKWKKSHFGTNEKNQRIIGYTLSKGNSKSIYNLSEAKGLFTELAKINPCSQSDILKFCRTFGLPIGQYEAKTNNEFSKLNHVIKYKYITLHHLQELIMYFHFLFNIFKKIIINSTTTNIHNEDEKRFRNNCVDNFTTNEELDIFNTLLHEHNIFKVKLYSTSTYKKNWNYALHHNNLIDYAIFQMFKALINNSEFNKCKYCGGIFEIDHKKMQFCPPLPFRKRSSCEMAYHNKSRRL